MKETTISLAGPDDAQSLARIGAETFVETFSHLYKEQDLNAFLASSHSIAIYRKLLADPATRIWLARDRAGAPAGYVSAGPCYLPLPGLPARSGELQRLYAYKAFQGAGLGTQLLELALDWMEENFRHLYLSVYAENTGAQRLYRRYGFERVHEYEFMVGDHADPEWIMKRIADPRSSQ